ncbi:hypothetical protein [Bacillus coreaensis]
MEYINPLFGEYHNKKEMIIKQDPQVKQIEVRKIRSDKTHNIN